MEKCQFRHCNKCDIARAEVERLRKTSSLKPNVRRLGDHSTSFGCAVCGNTVGIKETQVPVGKTNGKYDNFCAICGQKQDWS